jgi:predicted MPP superfamily phosphohydrolase
MSLAFVGKKEEVAAAPAGKVRVTRRSLLAGAAGLIGLSAAGTAGYAAAIEPQQLVVTPYTLKPRGWPAGRKLTITVIADLHAGGPDMPLPNVQRIVDTANALKSDVIVMLGDYIARYRFAVERIPDPVWAAELARLQAPLGVWAILGNHDWWYDLAGVRNALAEVRIPLLENQAVLLGPEGERVWVAGIGDQIAYRIGHGRFRGVDDLPGTLAHVTTDDPVILLAHEPDIFPRVPSRYGKRYAYGHVIERERHLIVSGGLGTSIIPARFGVPPEIVHVTHGA